MMVIEMYKAKNTYEEYKEKDEIKYHLPEWFRILKEAFREYYDNNCLAKCAKEKEKKESVEDLLW